jgi:hypothetical protein
MAKAIKPVQVGSTDTLLVASRANELISSVNSLLNMQVKPEGAGTIEVGDAGNAILTINVKSGVAPVEYTHPFMLKKTDAGAIRVYYGMLNQFVPQGMYIGDDPPFTLPALLSAYVYLEFDYDDNTGVISNVQINQGSSVPASTDTHLYKSLGSYSDSGNNIANVVMTSLWFERCGTYDLFGSA